MKFLSYVSCFIIAISIAGCEQVIDIDLKTSDARLVIDARLTDDSGSCVVKLSKVVNYNSDNVFPGVSGASVRLRDDLGAELILTETANGIYTAPGFSGTVGRTYTLTVVSDGKTYTSTSYLSPVVEIDSLQIDTTIFFIDTNVVTNVFFKDPGGLQNQYRYIYSINDTTGNEFRISDDQFSDGLDITESLFSSRIKAGDSITVELWSIDKGVFTYYKTLNDVINGQTGQEAAPANPTSNITGGAMGYFSAYSVSRKGIRVPL